MSIWAIDIETLERPIDPRVLEAYRDTVKEELVKESAIEARVQKYKERWKFTVEGAQLLAFGAVKIDGLAPPEFFAHEDPVVVAKEFLQFMSREYPRKLVAFNGNRFDFPILASAIANSFEFAMHSVADYKLYDLADYPMGKYIGVRSLASFCKILGVATEKSGDGSQVANYWESDKANHTTLLHDYCINDCQLVADCYRKLSLFYPM